MSNSQNETVYKTEQSIASNQFYREGLIASVPLVIGYLPVAFTFGLLAKQSEINMFNTMSMSGLVYAGASQFMGLSMFLKGISTFQILLATFILNFRNFVMSLSFNHQQRHIPKGKRIYLSLTLTDENYAITSLNNQSSNQKLKDSNYFIALHSVAYLSWLIGTLLGVLFSNFIPATLRDSMGISIYALFIGLLTPAIRSNWKSCVIVLISMFLNSIFSLYISKGWSLIISTLLASSFSIILLKGEDQK
ncbi:AzlC family ABC transporter permease [Bacillus sp. RG28]|uniref:AzlC family ABC transporter permease n=1 Tax=Gottfriedia endophytica TaxID=2820819 RepID=A0A940SH87_9BACI|nr:AzlC family ABC transporter permease [Gottfriedia endophytica]MBP0725927.1 AzlC family ABC transporter permease [Gottfriedia endophytica]